MNELIEKLEELYQDNRRIYEENGRQDFDAGRIDGIKQALEIVSTSYNDNLRK